MTRAPFQVLVFPYRTLESGETAYAVFRRRDDGMSWQAISGGGEDSETPLEAARREASEHRHRRPPRACPSPIAGHSKELGKRYSCTMTCTLQPALDRFAHLSELRENGIGG